MNWDSLFADRTHAMTRSAVRELLKIIAQPGMISFAGGLPAAELFPIAQFERAAVAVLTRKGRQALQYSESEGLPALRDWIASRFSQRAARIDRQHVAIFSGGQQALDLIGRVLLNPGDRVIVENPTYLALLSAWRPLGVQFVPVDSDEDGMRVDQLERLLECKPKLIYTIPSFQNPQGTTLGLERRAELLRLVASRSLGLVEDNAYGELAYDSEPLPHLFGLEQNGGGGAGRVIHVGTFSKVLVPGLRLGWVVAGEPVIDKLVQAKQSADLHTSTFNQHLVLELVESGFLEEHLPVLRAEYRARRDTMLAALDQHMPAAASWTRPKGGMFLMLRLPGNIDGKQFLRSALARQVAFVPGEEFHLNGSGRNTARLNFTNMPCERILEGIKRMGSVLHEMLGSQASSEGRNHNHDSARARLGPPSAELVA